MLTVTALWELAPELVKACDIAPGQRVLDVAAGLAAAPSSTATSPRWPAGTTERHESCC